ncbi:MAG: thiamine pyrophosphate-dependent enzyme [bacterium]|nr:thiamine pyrophosphate-dependent enzyme [bacterium]
MPENKFNVENIDIAWCPGCGDFSILKILKDVFMELSLNPEDVCMVSGIGQAAKIPQYIKCNYFNGLHGCALPPATGIKAVNPNLTVIAESGDGDIYGEGGNHFIHCIRRNPDIVNIVHDNMIYGLTKGQASPTSRLGHKTPVQVAGVILEPFNPIAFAIVLGASFVARAFAGDQEQTKEILKKAIKHKGYALIDIFQPCVSFNKINTFQWFKEHTYYLDADYNPEDRNKALEKAFEEEKFPLGIIYVNKDKKSFEENLTVYREKQDPLVFRELNRKDKLEQLLNQKK